MSRRDATFIAAAFSPPFLLYLLTRGTTWALDSIYTIDSAEMVIAAHTLGIDHPPGHPLYLIFARLFSLLPFGRPDEGVILTSAVFGALTATFVALALRTRTGDTLASLGAGWTVAFVQVFWIHAVIAEVYTIQLAATGVCYAIAAAWTVNRKPAAVPALCFVLGLTASTNVLLAVLLGPGFAYLAFRSGVIAILRRSPRLAILTFASLLLGASPLLYIPIRLAGDGFISDFVFLNGYTPGSLRWYAWYLSAEEFTSTRITSTPLSHYPTLVVRYAGAFIDNASPFAVVLVAAGAFALLRGSISAWRRRNERDTDARPDPGRFERTVAIGFLVSVLPVLPYDVADRDVFYMPSFLHLLLIGGVGLARLTDAIRGATFPAPVKPWMVGAVAFCSPAFLAVNHYSDIRALTADTSSYNEREARFLALPDGAIVTSTDDGRATRWKYWQVVRGLRPDVRVETLGRLAPRYRGDDPDAVTGAAAELAPSLNLADRLRVLKGLRTEHPDRPLFTILDDRLPPELDHFRIRRAEFDGRLLRLDDRPPPERFDTAPAPAIPAEEEAFAEVDIIGIDITGLDQGMSRTFPEPIPVQARVVNGIIQRSEFVEIGVSLRKQRAGQYFAEFAFVDEQMRIPGARGFVAARSMQIAADDVAVGSYLRDSFTIKIPAYIPGGLHTLAVAINAVEEGEAGTYRGKALRRMVPVEASRAWAGQVRYQPLARIWLR